MKKIKFILTFGVLGTMLAIMPSKSNAASKTVTVTSNSSSGITEANLTATLDDGTVLGFRRYGSTVYLCGASSQQKELSIPDSILDSSNRYAITRIGYNLCDFDNAQSVTTLTLPPTIEYINNLPSTVNCLHVNNYMSSVNSSLLSNLTKVFVPEKYLTSYYETPDWSNYVLINAEGTEPLRITINMTKVGEFAQLLLKETDNWYKVNELTVVGELNTDDLNVFKRMKQLTKLDLSHAVITDIPNQFDGAKSTSNSRDGFNILEELSLPNVNSIGEYAFAQCYRLKSISIPKANSIGYSAFSWIGASHITLPEGLTSIASFAFYHSNLENITIPSTVTTISEYCFSYSLLSSVSIHSSVTTIKESAFRETKLNSVVLPGVTSIGYYAFRDCKQLVEVKFAEGLKILESEPFYGCTGLTEIDLPSTFNYMNGGAFRGCTNIKKVICRAATPPTHNNNSSILYGCDMTDVKLYVPAMSIDKYRAESGWKAFYTILPLEDKTSYVYIYDNATIDDATEFTDDCNLILDWCYQNRNGSTQNYCGALDYNGGSTFSLHDYKQYHYLGGSNYSNQYHDDAHFTSLIPNGSMRADNVQTTLRTYSPYIWYFISLPYDVKVSDIIYTDGVQFAIRKYSGLNRAQQSGDTWQNLTADSIMHAYEGYILKCNKEYVDFTFPAINNANKNKIFEKESVTMPLGEYLSEFEHNRSWNLIGNPYPCYYDTRRMDFTAPITVWNRYYERYDAYSPIDDAYILHPSQSFFVQRPVDQAAITFDKAGRQHDDIVQDLPALMKIRASIKTDRKIYNISMSDGTVEDHTRFVINGKASCAYELDKDASKFIDDDNTAMLVYTVENGVRYAINERPLDSGIVTLGFYAPTDGEYTLSLNTADNDDVILIDNATNTETVMSGNYHFNANAGYNDTRFSLSLGSTTGISEINVENDIVSANTPYSVYTIDGRLVGNYSAGNAANLSKGIYIINSKNTKHKIVVK